MLDFYTIDEHEIWETPDEARLVGSLSLEEYERLSDLYSALGWGPERPDYFCDRRLSFGQIQAGLQRLETTRHDARDPSAISAEQKLLAILRSALELGRGIQTYCD